MTTKNQRPNDRQHDVLPSHSSTLLYRHLHQCLKLLPCLSPWRFLNSRPMCLFQLLLSNFPETQRHKTITLLCLQILWVRNMVRVQQGLILLHNVWGFRWEESKIKGLDDSKAWDWNYLGVPTLPCPVLGWMTKIWALLKMSIRGLTHSLSMWLGLQYACVCLGYNMLRNKLPGPEQRDFLQD